MARLKVRRHQVDFAELQLEPGKSYIMGRHENADVMLQSDPGISRQHVSIEFVDSAWVVKSLSTHLMVSYEGKTHNTLSFVDGVVHFYVSPYEFELQMLNEEPSLKNEEVKGRIQAEDETPADGEVDEKIREPISSTQSQVPAHEAELSFHGNEEHTNDVQLPHEPYIKFMHESHSESLRLKGNKWVAGRDNIAQIQLDDKKASRQHFSLEKVGEQFFIRDLQSANGTLLNGQELPHHEPREIKSGDIITVNQLTMIFEMRDLSFSEKLKDLPLQAYSGPLILSSQEWDLAGDAHKPHLRLETKELAQLTGTVQRITSPVAKKNHLRTALLGMIAVLILGYAVFQQMSPGPQRDVAATGIKTFESLPNEEKKFVVDSYNSAQNYYQEGRIQNALTQLAYVHKTLPFYKDSRELETKLVEAQETLRQKEFIAQQRREQEETRIKVQNIVADCRDRYRDSVDVNSVKGCLTGALQLDPENSDALSIVAEIELRLNQALEAERKLKEFNDNAQKGRDLFYRAKNLLQNKDFHEAITAFSAHINASLPDPDQLKPSSQRHVASIEQHIETQKRSLMGKANSLLNSNNLRDAILSAEQAKRVDPYDYSIANFIEQTRRSLEVKMRPLYEESVIEERFGNFEICKAKWQEIVAKDIPTGEYYLKAKRKLQQYGP